MKILIFSIISCYLLVLTIALPQPKGENVGVSLVAGAPVPQKSVNSPELSSYFFSDRPTFLQKTRQFVRFMVSFEDLSKALEVFFKALQNSQLGSCPDSYAEELEKAYKQLQRGISWKLTFTKKIHVLDKIHLTLIDFMELFRKLHSLKRRLRTFDEDNPDDRSPQERYTDEFHLILWEAQFLTISAFTYYGSINLNIHKIKVDYERRIKLIRDNMKRKDVKNSFPELQAEFNRVKNWAQTMERRFHEGDGRSFWN